LSVFEKIVRISKDIDEDSVQISAGDISIRDKILDHAPQYISNLETINS